MLQNEDKTWYCHIGGRLEGMWNETSSHTGIDLQYLDRRIVMMCLQRNGEEGFHIVDLVWWIPRTLNPTGGEQYEGGWPNMNSKPTEYNNRVQNVEEVHNITRWQTSIYAHTIERVTKVSTHILWDEDKTRAARWCEGWGTKVGTHILWDEKDESDRGACARDGV